MKKFQLTSIGSFLILLLIGVNLFAQSFTANPTNGCAPLTVTFTNVISPTDTIQFAWNFWDGSPTLVDTLAPNKTVTHTYTTTGNFSPNANVFDITTQTYLGNTYGSSGSIWVNGLGGINSPDTACITDAIGFCPNGQANSCFWSFGDGNTSNNYCANHTYTITGTYTMTLNASSTCGNYNFSKTVVVNSTAKPQANFGFSNWNPCPTEPVTFNSNQYVSYFWNFGDGNSSTQPQPVHSYTAVGSYTVSLKVTNGCGKSDSTYRTLNVSGTNGFPNNVGIGLGSNQSCPGQSDNLYVYGVNNYPKYVWNFGDSSPKDSSSSNVNHTYTTVGTYTVSCKVKNYCGKDSTFYNTINVSSYSPFPNNPGFQLTNSSPACPGSNINLNAPGGYNNYKWNFGDGSPVVTTTQNWNNHIYGNTLTTYNASVTITSACGNDTTLSSAVQITNNAPWNTQNFQFNGGPNPSCPNGSVGFQAPCGYNNYQWDFGDGSSVINTNNNCNTQHTYGSSIITYTASVNFTNTC